jgi:glycosyltransferase involved in cell wall biosynthesis
MPTITELDPDASIKISVVIPIGNLPLHKKNVLNLVSTAREINAEIILVFDGTSKEEIHELEEIIVDSRNDIVVTSSTCNNPGGSRNLGKVKATGKWITFWDCDDNPNAMEVRSMIYEANRLNCEVAIGRFNLVYVDEDTNELSRELSRELNSSNCQFIVGLTPGIWRFAFRNSTAKGVDFPELRMGEDQVFIARFFSRDREVHLSNRVSYNYLVGRKSQLNRDLTSINDKIESAKMLSKEFKAYGNYFPKLKFTMLTKMYLSIFKLQEFPIKVRLENIGNAIKYILSNPNLFYGLVTVLLREKAE